MRKYYRDCVEACRSAGLNPLGIEHRGKHWAVVCTEGRIFCASTPSDHRHMDNLKRAAKRLARAPMH